MRRINEKLRNLLREQTFRRKSEDQENVDWIAFYTDPNLPTDLAEAWRKHKRPAQVSKERA